MFKEPQLNSEGEGVAHPPQFLRDRLETAVCAAGNKSAEHLLKF